MNTCLYHNNEPNCDERAQKNCPGEGWYTITHTYQEKYYHDETCPTHGPQSIVHCGCKKTKIIRATLYHPPQGLCPLGITEGGCNFSSMGLCTEACFGK